MDVWAGVPEEGGKFVRRREGVGMRRGVEECGGGVS